MIAAARVAAAIGILDQVLAGAAAERVLTTWARQNRYAGSGDRAAIRDHVFDALRCRRSFAWLGGAETGRGLMLGALRAAGADPATVFTGARFAPEPLRPEETGADLAQAPMAVQLDVPDALLPYFQAALGEDTAAVLSLLRQRAPVFLRVNPGKTDRAGAIAALAADGVEARPHPLAETALEVTGNARRIQAGQAYAGGLVELQDAASQAVIEALPSGGRVLDFCAGGGGKALALAARGARVFAHDVDPARMRDIPARAARAGVEITCLDRGGLAGQGPYDLVLCDAPCTGSGSWRRAPEAKWRTDPARLQALTAIQDQILRQAASLVAPGGTLAYVTCSLFRAENDDRVGAFLNAHPGWSLTHARRLTPLDGGDGFFVARLFQDTKQPQVDFRLPTT